MSRSLSKDLCIVEMTEASNLKSLQRVVLNAFLEGFYAFRFRMDWKGKGLCWNVGLPEDADEACALEMAEEFFNEWLLSVGELMTGKVKP
jgi:hypothetical protein